MSIFLSFNGNFLTLIPKEDNTMFPGKYSPITLCNIIFKIVTKVITNCLKPILLHLITSNQYGYVNGRQILDGIILAHEVMSSLKNLKKLGMLIKLDMSIAFDKLKWEYIETILLAFGFIPHWT